MMCKKLFFLTSFLLVYALICTNVASAYVLEIPIATDNDDVEEGGRGNPLEIGSSDLEILVDPDYPDISQVIGLRFLDVQIPKGSTIVSAAIRFDADDVDDAEHVGNAYVIIEGELSPDAGVFENIVNNVSDRPKTTAQVQWTSEPWPVDGGSHQKALTADISSVIQEIIDQDGWVSGNALVLILRQDPATPSVGHRECESFDGAGGNIDQRPTLLIEFTSKYAMQPDPADGAMINDTWVNLMWEPGNSAVSHDVYLGDNLTDVQAGAESAFQGNQAPAIITAGFPGFPYPEGLVPGATYYWRIDEVEADGTKIEGDVWSFMVPSKSAYNPNPADGGMYVDPDVELSWTAGFAAKLHTVYFGDNFDEVNNATGGLPLAATTYTPGTLEMDKTYYWRVDEFDAINTYKGNVWSFSTLPIFEMADPNLVGWWKFDEGSGDIALDFSGYGNDGELRGTTERVDGILGGALDLTGDDYVVIDGVVDDITSTNITLSIWIKSTQGNQGDMFAANDSASGHPLEFYIEGGYPGRYDGGDTTYTTAPVVGDGQWHMMTYVREGNTGYIYVDGVQAVRDTASFDLSSVTRWSIGQEWDDSTPSNFYVGMVDDARFYNSALTADQVQELMRGDPLLAWNPNPGDNSTVGIQEARKPISWSAGDEAVEHDVYFGTDKDAVSNADASDTTGIYQGRQGGTSLTLPAGSVEWGGGPYYWRVDENNNDGSISTGATWSFSVADYLIVDDFESYNDLNPDDPESKRIFYTWLDGYDNPAINGSVVGHASPPFAETTIVHSGMQAMPLFYDNGVGISEATMTLTSQRDWTEEGVG
ncbi:MAG: LamG domain-containing protein, partial [Planctomycetota bacterium]